MCFHFNADLKYFRARLTHFFGPNFVDECLDKQVSLRVNPSHNLVSNTNLKKFKLQLGSKNRTPDYKTFSVLNYRPLNGQLLTIWIRHNQGSRPTPNFWEAFYSCRAQMDRAMHSISRIYAVNVPKPGVSIWLLYLYVH